MARKKIVAGNWKMNGDNALVESMVSAISDAAFDQVDIIICPPYIYLDRLINESKNVAGLSIGAQNCHVKPSGAHTGEISAAMLQQFGCEYVIIGHSERRSEFAESNEVVASKAQAAIAAGLIPIICFGETKAERDANATFNVLKAQLAPVLAKLGTSLSKSVLAYEPVWAIGTGDTATPNQAEEVHGFIRAQIGDLDKSIAETISILYGGSVKPGNAQELFSQPNIDGGLIGGASLKEADFVEICKLAER